MSAIEHLEAKLAEVEARLAAVEALCEASEGTCTRTGDVISNLCDDYCTWYVVDRDAVLAAARGVEVPE